MSTNPLVQTIEPDEPSVSAPQPSGKINAPSNARAPVVLTPTNRTVEQMASNPNDAESGMSLQQLWSNKSQMNTRMQDLQGYFDR